MPRNPDRQPDTDKIREHAGRVKDARQALRQAVTARETATANLRNAELAEFEAEQAVRAARERVNQEQDELGKAAEGEE